MIRDAKLIAEQYTRIINEWMPVFGDEAGGGIGNAADINTDTSTAYNALKGYAKKPGNDVVALTQKILDKIKTNIFTKTNITHDGKVYDLYFPGEPMEFRERVKGVIEDVMGMDKTQQNVPAERAARILDNVVLKVVRVKGSGKVVSSNKAVDAAAAKIEPAVEQAIKETPLAAVETPVEPDEDKELGPMPEDKPKTPEEKAYIGPKRFRIIGEYQVESEMSPTAYAKIPDEERRENAKLARARLISNVGREFSGTGEDFINKIKMPYSSAKQALTDLLHIGGISEIEQNNSSEVLEGPGFSENPSDVAAELEREQMGGMTPRHDEIQ